MGKITEVYYEEVDPSEIDLRTAGEFYFNTNLIQISPLFFEGYEVTEDKQLRARNRLLAKAMEHDGIPELNISTSMLAISSLKNKVILVAEKK